MSNSKPFWVIGDLHNPLPEDRLKPFDRADLAINAAGQRAQADERSVIAVWDHRDVVVVVFTAGLMLFPGSF